MARVVFFASDRAEIAQARRILSVRRAGHRVMSFSTAKQDGQLPGPPGWTDVDLGRIENKNLPKRLLKSLLGLPKILAHGRHLRQADVIIARNIDMVFLAWAARFFARARAPLVYECLDIHGVMTGPGLKPRLARAAERFLLSRCALLVLSSPGFHRHYFSAVQGYRGPWELLENKLVFPGPPPPRPDPGGRRSGPLVLGWVGSIRCRPSLLLLAETARRMGADLKVRIHGMVHHHAIPDFGAILARHPNLHYHGPYAYPDGLAAAYAGCDLVWAQDLWQAGANSAWLLPNRIYEASWFGCPSIAVAQTETGRAVAARGLGFTVAQPDAGQLAALLSRLHRQDLAAARARLLAMPDAAFCLGDDDINRVISAALEQRAAVTRQHPEPKT